MDALETWMLIRLTPHQTTTLPKFVFRSSLPQPAAMTFVWFLFYEWTHPRAYIGHLIFLPLGIKFSKRTQTDELTCWVWAFYSEQNAELVHNGLRNVLRAKNTWEAFMEKAMQLA